MKDTDTPNTAANTTLGMYHLALRAWTPSSDAASTDKSNERWLVCAPEGSSTAQSFRDRLSATAGTEIADLVLDFGAPNFDRLAKKVEAERAINVVLFLNEFGSEEHDPTWSWAKGLIRVCQELVQHATQIWFVTNSGVYGHAEAHPAQAFAIGLGRCLAAEFPTKWRGILEIPQITTDPFGSMNIADLTSSAEDELVLLDGELMVPRLGSLERRNGVEKFCAQPDATYIVTGGLVSIAFNVCEWLLSRNAQNILLLGSTPADGKRKELLDQLNSSGAKVRYDVCDVGDSGTLNQVLQNHVEVSHRPVDGIFHLASSWRRDGRSIVGPLQRLDNEAVHETTWAKSEGGFGLSEFALLHQVPNVVLFSTAASILGSLGQVNYAASSAVLDGLAVRLRSSGLNAVSISYGPIASAGFAKNSQGENLHALWRDFGINRLELDDVLRAIDIGLASEEASVLAANLDTQKVAEKVPWIGQRPIFQELFQSRTTERAHTKELEALLELPDAERKAFLVEHISQRISEMSGVPADQIDPNVPFIDSEIDSLLALELLFSLERSFGIKIKVDEEMMEGEITLNGVAETALGLLPK